MTKKEWKSIRIGIRVSFKTWMPIDGKPVDVTLKGTIVRINSNFSQVLVRFDESILDIWYGRTQIELLKTELTQ